MSRKSLVIRMTKERRPRLGITFGCVLAVLCGSAGSAGAQVVQAANEDRSEVPGISAQLAAANLSAGDAARTSSRRVLILTQKEESSPSDASKTGDTKDEKSSDEEKKEDKSTDEKSADKKADEKKADDKKSDDKSDKKDNNTKADTSRGITPVQSSGLKLNIDRVNISTSTIGTGVLPENTAAKRAAPSMALLDGQSRGIPAQQVNWKPANVCHFPLYFEDAMLERHGHVRWGCAQPIASGVKYLATMPLLPYLKTLQPPCEPRYALGHFRPGSCAPALKDHLPWDRRAATVEAVSLGAFFWAAPL